MSPTVQQICIYLLQLIQTNRIRNESEKKRLLYYYDGQLTLLQLMPVKDDVIHPNIQLSICIAAYLS